MQRVKSNTIEGRTGRSGNRAYSKVADNRHEARVITLYRASALETESSQGLCVIKNLSTNGAMIRTAVELAVHESLVLVMASGMRVESRVVWVQEKAAGLKFNIPISLSKLLDRGGLLSTGNTSRQMPRLSIAVAAKLTYTAGMKFATTCDISTHGARFICPGGGVRGMVKIELAHLPLIAGRVLWSKEDYVGCIFDRALEIDELTTWIRTVH